MSIITTFSQPGADPFPALVEGVRAQFGDEGLAATAERFVAAEGPDFLWEGRIRERYRGEWLDADEHVESLHCFLVLSHFRGQFVVASVVVDGDERPRFATRQRPYGDRQAAEDAFHRLVAG